MKICIISPFNLPIPATAGGAIETIIDQLIEQNEIKKRIKIDCYSISNDKGKNDLVYSENSKIIYLHKNKVYEKIQHVINIFEKAKYKIFKGKLDVTDFMYIGLANLIKDKNYDYIIFEAGNYSAARYFLKYYKKEQIILHLHHTMRSSAYDEYFGKVICVSQYVKNEFMKKSNINSENIHILKNVVNPNVFLNKLSLIEKDEIKKTLNIKSDEKILLFCGRIIKEKGIKELLLASRRVKDKNIKLIIIGSSNFGKETMTKFEREILDIINSSENIIYLGFVQNKDLYKYYQIADIFVMPSNWEEAAGLVNLEAILSQLPIITTRMGGIPEYVSEDVGIFIENNENFIDNIKFGIESLIKDEEKRKSLSENCLKKIEDITLEKFYDEFVDILFK